MSGSDTEEKTDIGSDDDHGHDDIFDESQTELHEIVGGRYRLSKKLGKGSFGETIIAHDLHLFDQPVVVKVLRNFSKIALNHFAREARRLAELEHPRIPRIKASFQQGSEHYIVMEYIQGKNLSEVLKAEGPMKEDQASLFMEDVLDALQHIHSEQVIHRDIKLENVVRKDANKAYYLVDFGASKQIAPESQLVSTAVGTTGYMAPEVGLGKSTFQSDLFSLGATTLALLTGKKPQELSSHGQKPFDQAIQDLSSGGKINQDFGNLLSSLLDARLTHRMASASAALAELWKCAPLTRRRSLLHSPSSSSLARGGSSPNTPSISDERKRSLLAQPEPVSPVVQSQVEAGRKRSGTEGGPGGEIKRPRVEEKSPFFASSQEAQTSASQSSKPSTEAKTGVKSRSGTGLGSGTRKGTGVGTGVGTSTRTVADNSSSASLRKTRSSAASLEDLESFVWSKLARELDLPMNQEQYHDPNEELNRKVVLWQGSITSLGVDAIVNAAPRNFANSQSGVNGAVHRLGGEELTAECKLLGVAEPGETRCTKGHALPCSFVFHTVGPNDEDPALLRKCYQSALDALIHHPGKTVSGHSGLVPLRSIAFCCISAGGNAFPKSAASKLAVASVRKWLDTDDNADKVDFIVFCISKDDQVNYNLYEEKLMYNFPLPRGDQQGS